MSMKNRTKKQRASILLIAVLLSVAQHAIAMVPAEETCVIATEGIAQNPVNNGLLIFLDDSESDTAEGEEKIGAMSNAFLSAFGQQAGPIVVSASIIANVREYQKPDERDPQKLVDRYNSIVANLQNADDAIWRELKSIIRAALSFNETTVQPWIIKKINAELYLLLPKKYLQDKNISEEDVQEYISTDSITSIEQQLGLKVNHMQTVTNIDEIKKPLPEPPVADYFMDALWNNKSNTSNLFVTNNEYQKYNNNAIPLWSIFISGHGTMTVTIVGLDLQQFKQFLGFLENKIHTRLLYYSSCYAAGINSKILYEDLEKGIDKTYSFAIITQALTDTAIRGFYVVPSIDQGVLKPWLYVKYLDFLKKITMSDIINYHALADFWAPNVKSFGAEGLAQIKFPGLPWFSVIDDDKVCSIGSILARTRTAPLDIATFFAKKGKQAAPLAVLLYAQEIPFELIVNTKNETGLPPVIISMIPGNTIHYIKKISSEANSVDSLLYSFVRIQNLAPQKIFIIDEMQGNGSEGTNPIIRNVVVKLNAEKNSVYYMLDDILFKSKYAYVKGMKTEKADNKDAAEYAQLLELCNPKKVVVSTFTADQIKELQTKVNILFAQQLTHEEAQKNIVQTLELMPNGVVLRVPKIKGTSCPPNEECWVSLFIDLSQYTSFGVRKVLWFDELELYNEEAQAFTLFKNIVIDIDEGNATVFATSHTQKRLIASNKTGVGQYQKDYVSPYATMFEYFNEHGQLPEQVSERKIPTTQELLTPEAIAKIGKVQEEKQKNIKSRKSRRTKRCESKIER